MTRRPRYTTLVLALLAGLLAASAEARRLGEKTLEPCHLPNERQEVLCGAHTVYEDRAAGAGRQIEIRFAVIPAVGEEPLDDPLVIFAGGPGQAAMEMAPFVRQALSEVGEQRDIVLVDQRGMGESNGLDCEMEENELSFEPLALEELARETITRCLDAWDADVRLYTQDLANEDIHEILLALGYERVNLYGASWGTRSALLYAHRYPEQVRSVVLDGALPPENTAPLHAAVDGDRALRSLFEACAADRDCQAAFPALEDDFRRALEQLEPEGSPLEVSDPLTGESLRIVLTRDVFGGLVRNILYSPELSRVLPLAIHRAAEGDHRPLLGVSSFFATQSAEVMTLGGSLAIFCAEELARASEESPRADTEPETLIGDGLLEGLRNACSVWPERAVPTVYSETVTTDAPTLVLSGEVDPITPPRWGEAMAEALPNARHLVAPATGHNVSPVGCAPELIARFIAEAGAEGLDAGCLDELERPSFFIDASGPAMTAQEVGEGEDR